MLGTRVMALFAPEASGGKGAGESWAGRIWTGEGTCGLQPHYLNSSNFRMCDWKRKRKSQQEGRTTPASPLKPLDSFGFV